MHTKSDENSKFNRVLLQRLNAIIPKIVDAFDPEEIIMYGSYARGDNDIYSDIDIIIVVKIIDLRFQDRAIKAMEIIEEEEDENQIPINPIVYTRDEFKNMLKTKESFLISALNESVLIWKKDQTTDMERQLEHKEFKSEFQKYIPQ